MRAPVRRIALVQAGLGAGGTEKILRLLAKHLDGQGHRVTMLAIAGHPSKSYYAMPEGVTLRAMEEELGSAATRSATSRIAWIRKAVREAEVELVVSFLTKINVQVAVACLGLGVRRIASERNNFLRQRMNPLWRMALPITLATSDVAVMLTEGARGALPAWACKRAIVIPNPAPAGLERPPTISPPRRLIAVGRLTEQKGFDVLLCAIKQARERGCNLDLTIFGEGEDREKLTGLAQTLGISGHVQFPGRSLRPHDWVGKGGIFVLSSRYEGFANVLIEAMASGFAVISTACDWGPSEIVTHGRDGLLVPPEDPEALAEAILRLSEDDALRARLANAATLRATDFSQERILAAWDEAVAYALGERRYHTASG